MHIFEKLKAWVKGEPGFIHVAELTSNPYGFSCRLVRHDAQPEYIHEKQVVGWRSNAQTLEEAIGDALPKTEEVPVPNIEEPPCWHRSIGDGGICTDCGKRAAISLKIGESTLLNLPEEYHIEFSTQIEPGKLVATRVRIDQVTITDMDRVLYVNLCDHPLYADLMRYCKINQRKK